MVSVRWRRLVGQWLVLLVLVVLPSLVHGQPSISGGSSLLLAGDEHTLQCSEGYTYSTSDTLPSVFPLTWSYKGAQLAAFLEQPRRVDLGATRFHMTYTTYYKITVQRSDNNQDITCTSALSNPGERTGTFTFIVNTSPDIPVITGPQQIISGRNYTWQCQVDGASQQAPEVTWNFANGTRIVDNSLYSNGVNVVTDTFGIRMYNVNSSLWLIVSEGAPNFILACEGTHVPSIAAGKSSVRASLPVTVYYPPQVTSGGVITENNGSSVTLNCVIQASPALTSVAWTLNGSAVSVGSSSRYSGGNPSNPSLTISPVLTGDSGNYTCSGGNNVANATGQTIQLFVRFAPVVTYASNPVGANLGQRVNLPCQVAAYPAYTDITWYTVNANTGAKTTLNPSTDARYSGGSSGTTPVLTILSLAASDAGLYRCAATNSMGSTEGGNLQVQVFYAPSIVTITGLVGSYQESESISLTCSADGFPQPSYTWYRGSRLLTSGSQLTIASAAPADNAQFRCKAENSEGDASQTVSVVVLYKPRPGSSLKNVSANVGDTVTLTCLTDANPPPTSYSWSFGSEQLSAASTSPVLTVRVTNSSQLGRYSCQATNSQGPNTQPISVFIKDKGNAGESKEGGDGLPTATLVLIIIVCLIVLIVLILIFIYCCVSKKWFKSKNKVRSSERGALPAIKAKTKAPVTPSHKPAANGYSHGAAPPGAPMPNGRIDLNEEKMVPGTPNKSNGIAPISTGMSISLPGPETPRPHHLPPLGQDGGVHEMESARDETPREKKKKKKKKKHHDQEEVHYSSPQHDPNV